MKKLYLDISIPSAVFDRSKPERLEFSKQWFETESRKFKLYTSQLALEELDELISIDKRNNIKDLIVKIKANILDVSEEALNLSKIYIEKGAVPKTEPEDAVHIAVATVNGLDCLASWDFKHIVSPNPIRKIHELNEKLGYKFIEIGSLDMFL